MSHYDDTPPERSRQGEGSAAKLQRALGSLGEVRKPEDAEEPILEPSVRRALFSWLAEINAREELKAAGLKPRSTALLYGPPGCGKTTLAHHLAARLGVPLVVVGTENVVSGLMGSSEKAVANLFDVLVSHATPCVLFIDEIEGLGGKRDKNTLGGADNARTQILGVLLRKLEAYSGFAIGATNRERDIDPALWRRFHMQIAVEMPAFEERFAICKRYLHPFELSDDDMDVLADVTVNASPALLRQVMEGVKRQLVLKDRLRIDVSNPVGVFGALVSSVSVPPGLAVPPLWKEGAVSALASLSWPPRRVDGAA